MSHPAHLDPMRRRGAPPPWLALAALLAALCVGCDDDPAAGDMLDAQLGEDAGAPLDGGADMLPPLCGARDWQWVEIRVERGEVGAREATVTAAEAGHLTLDDGDGEVDIRFPPTADALALPAVGEAVRVTVSSCTPEPRDRYAQVTTPAGALLWEGGHPGCRPDDRRLHLIDDTTASGCRFVPPGSTVASALYTPVQVRVEADDTVVVGAEGQQQVEVDGVPFRV